MEIDADGDVHIGYGLKSWIFHPAAVTKVIWRCMLIIVNRTA